MHILRLIDLFDNNLSQYVGTKIPEQGFGMRKYGYIIDINEKGNFVSVSEVEGECFMPSDNGRSGSKKLPNCMYDKVDYFRNVDKFKSFQEYHTQYLSEILSPTVKNFLSCINNPSEVSKLVDQFNIMVEIIESSTLYTAKVKASKVNKINSTLALFRVDGKFLHEDLEAINTWKQCFKEWIGYEDENKSYSMVDGSLINPIKKQLSVDNGRYKMCSDNKPIFTHYGLSQPFACSYEQSYKYSEAIKYLSHSENHCINLYNIDTRILIWADNDKDEELSGFLTSLNDRGVAIENLTKCIKKAKMGVLKNKDVAKIHDMNKIYILILTYLRGQGRVIVKKYIEEDIQSVFSNVISFTSFFEEYISDYTNIQFTSIPSIQLLSWMLSPNDKQYQSFLHKEMFESVIMGKKWSNAVLSSCIDNCMKKGRINDNGLLYVIMKQRGVKMENESIAKVGKLIAIIENIKRNAGYTDSSIQQRCVSNIRSSFAEILKKVPHYINDMRKNKKIGLAIHYEKMTSEIVSGIDIDSLKTSSLNTDETCLMLVSYWEQKNKLFTKKNDNSKNEMKGVKEITTEDDEVEMEVEEKTEEMEEVT